MARSLLVLTCHKWCENQMPGEVIFLFAKRDFLSDSMAWSSVQSAWQGSSLMDKTNPFWGLTQPWNSILLYRTTWKVNNTAQVSSPSNVDNQAREEKIFLCVHTAVKEYSRSPPAPFPKGMVPSQGPHGFSLL